MINEKKASFTLTKQVKEKWVAALRSGKYKQGASRLKTEDGSYCCLGVLQMVTDGQVETRQRLYRSPIPHTLPTSEYRKRVADDDRCSFSVFFRDYLTPLALLNDKVGLSFEQIADLIEEQVETR